MMFDLIIAGGRVATEGALAEADLAVADGKITAVAAPGTFAGTGARETVDAAGLLVLPGAIDSHTHLALQSGGLVTSDDYETGTRAAVAGGVTTVFDYPTQTRGETIIEEIEKRRAMAEGKLHADLAFHCAVTDLGANDELLSHFRAAADYGVTSLKCYMAYRSGGLYADDAALVKILEKTRDEGMLVAVHAENGDVLDARRSALIKEGKTAAWFHYVSRPEWVEAEAVKRAIHFAENLQAPLYIVHLACAEGVAAVAASRSRGARIFAETCPQYLEFTNDVYKRDDALRFICSPPMKGEESRAALWQALSSRVIDTVATDHCPFTLAEKEAGRNDFTKCPNGCGGVEFVYPYMLDAAARGKITYSRAVELCAAAPARIFGCENKGSLAAGKDADIVLYDPRRPFTARAAAMHGSSDHTIWEGRAFAGSVVSTFLRGKRVFHEGEATPEYAGRFVKCARIPCERVAGV